MPYIFKINTYKVLGGWCAILYLIVTLCIAYYNIYTFLNWSYTRSFIIGIFLFSVFGYMLIFNLTALVVSSENNE